MGLIVLLTSVLVAVATLVYSLAVREKDVPASEPVSPTAALEEKKESIYENLRDLQFEFRVGKLSEEDYQRAKVELQRELAGVLAEISGFAGEQAPAPKRKEEAAASPPASGLMASVCPRCGASFPQPMKFCGQCGGPMTGGPA